MYSFKLGMAGPQYITTFVYNITNILLVKFYVVKVAQECDFIFDWMCDNVGYVTLNMSKSITNSMN